MQTRALNPCLRDSALNMSCSGTTTQIRESVDPLCTAAVEEIGIASVPNRTVRIDVFWAGEVKSKHGKDEKSHFYYNSSFLFSLFLQIMDPEDVLITHFYSHQTFILLKMLFMYIFVICILVHIAIVYARNNCL